jgi:hypothetical protein
MNAASVHRWLSLLSLNKAWPIPSTAIPRDQSCQSSHHITNLADACESADLAYFTSGSDVQQLYADAAPVSLLPLSIVDWQEAIRYLVLNKVEVMEWHEDLNYQIRRESCY